jgi:hypothetical protein
VETAQNYAGTAYELPGAIKKVAQGQGNVPYQSNNPLLTQEQLQGIQTGQEIPKQIKNAAAIGSYAIPFGKGANMLTKAVLPGATVGAAQSLPEAKNAEDVVKGATLGAIVPSVLHGASAITNKIGGTAEKVANAGLTGQYGLTGKQASKLGANDVIDRFRNWGITKPKDLQNIVESLGGSEGELNKIVENAVSKAKNVNYGEITEPTEQGVKQLRPSINSMVDDMFNSPNSGLIPEGVATKNQNIIQKVLQTSQGAEMGNLNANPNNALKAMRQLESAGFKYTSSPDESTRQLGKIYLNTANEIEDRLYNVSGADKLGLPQAVTPEVIQKVAKYSLPLANELSKVQSVGEVRSLGKPLLDASKILQYSSENGMAHKFNLNDILKMGIAMRSPLDAAAVLGTTSKGQGIIGGIANKLTNVGDINPNAPTISGQIGSRIPGLPLLGNNQVNNNTDDNKLNHDNIVSNMYPENKPDETGHYQLSPTIQGSNPFMTEQQREKLEQGLTPGTPDYTKIEQKFSQDQQMAKAQYAPDVATFMQRASTVQKAANNLLDIAPSLPLGIINKYNDFSEARKYVDPQYQSQMTKLQALNDSFKNLYKSVQGEDASNDMQISPKDSLKQMQSKISFMTNYFSGIWDQYKQAYATVTSPSGTLNESGKPNPVSLPPINQQPEQLPSNLLQGGSLPQFNQQFNQ